jgi:hypothetical protein
VDFLRGGRGVGDGGDATMPSKGVIIALSTMMIERSNNWTLVGGGPAL